MNSNASPVTRHFIIVQGRTIHYRRAGSGPPVVLLHQTPQSSVTMEPLLALLSGRFTVLALDTPGFGLSDPLPGQAWSMADLAAALADTLDALGLRRVALCGQHTGATIAAEFALRWPKRVSALALDGYTAFSAEEQAAILPHQVPPFSPAWDGSHLAWAWARFRDGWMFFPWSVRSLATRRALEMPSPALIQSYQVMELLRSRESYRCIYPGVFAWDGVAAAKALQVPTLLACTADDQLYPHLDRLADLPGNVEIIRLPAGARDVLRQRQAEFAAKHIDGATAAPDAPPTGFNAAGVRRNYVHLADGRHLAYRQIPGDGEPRLVLHGSGSAGEIDLDRSRPAISFDLPGHGDSDQPLAWTAASMAADIAAALDILQTGALHVSGCGLGAAIAVELAHLRPAAVRSLHLEEVANFSDAEIIDLLANYAPAIVPRWDGTHLLSLWHQLRDREFFWPWYQREAAAARRVEPRVAAERIDALLFAALRCADWPAAHQAWFEWPAADRLAAVPCPVTFSAGRDDGWARDLERLARAADQVALTDAVASGENG